MSKLKPCPFCGGEAEMSKWKCGYYVSCIESDCFVCPETGDFESREEAIEAWNKRAGNEQ